MSAHLACSEPRWCVANDGGGNDPSNHSTCQQEIHHDTALPNMTGNKSTSRRTSIRKCLPVQSNQSQFHANLEPRVPSQYLSHLARTTSTHPSHRITRLLFWILPNINIRFPLFWAGLFFGWTPSLTVRYYCFPVPFAFCVTDQIYGICTKKKRKKQKTAKKRHENTV